MGIVHLFCEVFINFVLTQNIEETATNFNKWHAPKRPCTETAVHRTEQHRTGLHRNAQHRNDRAPNSPTPKQQHRIGDTEKSCSLLELRPLRIFFCAVFWQIAPKMTNPLKIGCNPTSFLFNQLQNMLFISILAKIPVLNLRSTQCATILHERNRRAKYQG